MAQVEVNLNSITTQMKAQMPKYLTELMEEAKRAAEAQFGGQAILTYEVGTTEATLTASGDNIGFLEFGTGTLVDSESIFASEMPYDVEPGSWSKEHAQTYQKWVEGGMNGQYPYDRTPKRGMWEAYKTIQENAQSIADKVFK